MLISIIHITNISISLILQTLINLLQRIQILLSFRSWNRENCTCTRLALFVGKGNRQ